jgi:hypothetical protein
MSTSPGNCQQKVELSQEIANAIQRKYSALLDHGRAVEAKQDAWALSQVLDEARTAETRSCRKAGSAPERARLLTARSWATSAARALSSAGDRPAK